MEHPVRVLSIILAFSISVSDQKFSRMAFFLNFAFLILRDKRQTLMKMDNVLIFVLKNFTLENSKIVIN